MFQKHHHKIQRFLNWCLQTEWCRYYVSGVIIFNSNKTRPLENSFLECCLKRSRIIIYQHRHRMPPYAAVECLSMMSGQQGNEWKYLNSARAHPCGVGTKYIEFGGVSNLIWSRNQICVFLLSLQHHMWYSMLGNINKMEQLVCE